MQIAINGGDKWEKVLDDIAKQASQGGVVKIGFLEGAKYPDGTPVAYIASVQEYGGTAKIPEHDVTLYRSINEKTGEFNKQGRFVKKSKSNFATTHRVKAHSITIPPRPFFRNAISENKGLWPGMIATIAKVQKFDTHKVLGQMAEIIKGEIQLEILKMEDPPNSPKTIKKKGFNKPLVETAHMLNSVDYEIHANDPQ